MNAELAYVDSSALAKWDPNESGSAEFVAFIRTQQVALISRLTVVEIRSLLARRLRAGDITAGYHRDAIWDVRQRRPARLPAGRASLRQPGFDSSRRPIEPWPSPQTRSASQPSHLAEQA